MRAAMTSRERIAFVDAMRKRGATRVEVDGVVVVFDVVEPPPAPVFVRPDTTGDDAEPMTDDAARDRLMLWSSS